ncbi:MAG: VOC family protein [Nocardioidaceae bacterium]
MSNSVVHFEIPADNFERVHGFYSDAFGWTMNHMPEMQYTMVSTTETNDQGMPASPGAINGGMGKRQSPTSDHPTVTIAVDDIDEAFEKISAAGGSPLGEKMAIADMGWAAYFKDSEGNVVGLWQNAG